MIGIPDWVYPYIGLLWRDGGHDHDGVDAYGLARLVLAEQAGLPLLAPPAASAMNPWPKVAKGSEQPFDLVRLRPAHVGVVVAPGWMLYTERVRTSGSTLACYREPPLRRRVTSFRRHIAMLHAE